jgi:Concanavalin A-like lectin/glucanases superfamily
MKKNLLLFAWMLPAILLPVLSCKKNEAPTTVSSERQLLVQAMLTNDIMPLPGNTGTVRNGLLNAASSLPSVVSPIVLVPQGSTPITEYQKRQIQIALENVRAWYQRELPSKDVRWEPIRYMTGAQTAAYYLTGNNVWNEIPAEIKTSFGWSPWETGTATNRIALVLGCDLLGWAGGNGYSDGRGLAIVGLESLIDLPRVANEWWGTQEFWHGTVIHELGHGLTLNHPDPNNTAYDNSIMKFHSDYKNKHLAGVESDIVQSNPATGTKGPKPIASWTYDRLNANGKISDEAGSNEVTLLNGALLQPALVENAAYFNGVNAQAVTAPNACNITRDITISAWVYPLSVNGSQTLVNKWYNMDSYMLSIQSGQFAFSQAFPGGMFGFTKNVTAPAVANKWQHIVAQGRGGMMQIYIDKVLYLTSISSGPAYNSLQASTRPVSMGNHPSWNKYNGYLKNVKIYNAMIPVTDIATY